MTDPFSITAAIQAAKGLTDFASAFTDVHYTTKYNKELLELHRLIFAANEEHAAALQRIRELEHKVMSFENWESEKGRYELKEIRQNTYAYTIKEAMRGAEPVHHLCANCYEKRQKAILQLKQPASGRGWVFHCPACRTDYRA